MKRFLLLLSFVYVTACSFASSDSEIATAVAQTLASLPTETPSQSQTPVPTNSQTQTQTPIPSLTHVPLSDLYLEDVLLLPRDLPLDFSGGQIKSKIPNQFDGISEAEQVIHLEIREGQLNSYDLIILLYESINDLDEAYDFLVAIAKEKGEFVLLSDIGEKAILSENVYYPIPLITGAIIPGGTDIKVVFSRCHGLVYLNIFSDKANSDVAITYAQRLDKRLTPLICR